MTTNLELLTRAVQMLSAVGVGDDPTAEEIDAALVTYQAMIDGFVALGGPLTPVLITADYAACENERIFNNGDVPYAVTLPKTVTDRKTGATRPPLNGAVVEIVGSDPHVYVFCAQLGSWNDVRGLTLAAEQPFGPEHDEGLAAMVAVRAAAPLQVPTVPQWVVALAEQGRRALRQRLRQSALIQTDPLLLNRFQRGCWG